MVYINITFAAGSPTLVGPFYDFNRAYAYIYNMQELGKTIVYDVFRRDLQGEV